MIRVADTRADLERCVEICNAVEPASPITFDQVTDSPGTFLLHEGGGYAFVAPSTVEGSAYAMVRVHPDARRRGVGDALVTAASTHARSLGCSSAWGRVRDGDSLAFVRRRGFDEVNREITVVRDLAADDGETAAGVVELRDEHLRGAYDVCVECVPEVHLPQSAAEAPYDEWLERERRDVVVSFVALDGDDVVGYACLYRAGLPHRLEHGLTAVRRTHRRRGIATALKQAEIAWAARHGYRELATDNAEGNVAIRAVNERLGYRPLPPTIIVSGSVV